MPASKFISPPVPGPGMAAGLFFDEMVEDKEELCHLATLHGVRRAPTLTKKKLLEALEVEIEKLLPRYANLRGMVLRLIDKVSLMGLPSASTVL